MNSAQAAAPEKGHPSPPKALAERAAPPRSTPHSFHCSPFTFFHSSLPTELGLLPGWTCFRSCRQGALLLRRLFVEFCSFRSGFVRRRIVAGAHKGDGHQKDEYQCTYGADSGNHSSDHGKFRLFLRWSGREGIERTTASRAGFARAVHRRSIQKGTSSS